MLVEKCLEKCAVWGGGKEVCGSGGLCGGSVQDGYRSVHSGVLYVRDGAEVGENDRYIM